MAVQDDLDVRQATQARNDLGGRKAETLSAELTALRNEQERSAADLETARARVRGARALYDSASDRLRSAETREAQMRALSSPLSEGRRTAFLSFLLLHSQLRIESPPWITPRERDYPDYLIGLSRDRFALLLDQNEISRDFLVALFKLLADERPELLVRAVGEVIQARNKGAKIDPEMFRLLGVLLQDLADREDDRRQQSKREDKDG